MAFTIKTESFTSLIDYGQGQMDATETICTALGDIAVPNPFPWDTANNKPDVPALAAIIMSNDSTITATEVLDVSDPNKPIFGLHLERTESNVTTWTEYNPGWDHFQLENNGRWKIPETWNKREKTFDASQINGGGGSSTGTSWEHQHND